MFFQRYFHDTGGKLIHERQTYVGCSYRQMFVLVKFIYKKHIKKNFFLVFFCILLHFFAFCYIFLHFALCLKLYFMLCVIVLQVLTKLFWNNNRFLELWNIVQNFISGCQEDENCFEIPQFSFILCSA